MDASDQVDPRSVVALLGDPTRRRLYDLVAASGAPLGRDDAAAAAGVSRELAAFHLDRLVAGGLLETEYRRLSGRSGPGAGRPAKLYRRAAVEVAVSLPARRYERAAQVFADALASLDEGVAGDAVNATARQHGARLGQEVASEVGPLRGRPAHEATLLGLLEHAGYEPWLEPGDRAIRLRNCPYRILSERQRELTCGMNVAWAAGLLEGLGEEHYRAELDLEPGGCCVIFRPGSPRARGPRQRVSR